MCVRARAARALTSLAGPPPEAPVLSAGGPPSTCSVPVLKEPEPATPPLDAPGGEDSGAVMETTNASRS